MDLSKLNAIFVSESEELLERLEQALLAIEKEPQDEGSLRTIFQVMHTIKGNAATMGCSKMAEYAHHLEDGMERIKDGALNMSTSALDVMLASLDIFHALLLEFQSGQDKGVDIQTSIDNLQRALSVGAPPQGQAVAPAPVAPAPVAPAPVAPAPVAPAPVAVAPVATLEPAVPSEMLEEDAEKKEARKNAKNAIRNTVVRVQLKHLDDIMNLVGELAITKSRLIQHSRELGVPGLISEVKFLERLSTQLQEEVLKTRMVPVDDIFERYQRVVRDIAHDLRKEISFVIQDNGISVDRVLLEKINEAVVHLLRNAIDHGIESKEKRKSSGKSTVGTVSLVARREKNYAVVDVIDDGGGIDVARVKEKAVRLGAISAEKALKMSDEEALYLVCHPSLSTKEMVSQFSGRGVGMDAVQESVESINGHLDIHSVLGQGSRFSLFLPLNLAIIQALLFQVGEQTFALPLADVLEIVSLGIVKPKIIDKQEVIALRSEVLPLVRLNKFFNIPSNAMGYALVVQSRTARFALVVDQLVGRQEIVLKNLTGFLKTINGIGGATILGDGRAIMIVDIQEGFL
ncbi:MAG: chemotaxis protein CheA [Elusimicrobiota bacterium]